MNEFDIIATFFAPLAKDAGACGLKDDVAVLAPSANKTLIVTTDTLVEGVHFRREDPLDTVGQKLVRVNVSDVLSKGGQPQWASLALTWPSSRDKTDIKTLAEGLKRDFDSFGISLIGGDTTSTSGPLTLTLTLHGECAYDGPVRRSGGQPGADLWVSGCIGDGWLGLQAAEGLLEIGPKEELERLSAYYQVPQIPDVRIAEIVARYATASLDVSDGLLADAQHLAAASEQKAIINLSQIPLSKGGTAFTEDKGEVGLLKLLSGGDDYQVLFSVPAGRRDELLAVSVESGVPLTRIGSLTKGEGAFLEQLDGTLIRAAPNGWKHF